MDDRIIQNVSIRTGSRWLFCIHKKKNNSAKILSPPLPTPFPLTVDTLTSCSRAENVFCGVQINSLFHGTDISIFFEIHKIFRTSINFENVSRRLCLQNDRYIFVLDKKITKRLKRMGITLFHDQYPWQERKACYGLAHR